MVENIYGCGENKFDYLEYNVYPKFIFTYTNPTDNILEGYVYEEDNYEESKSRTAISSFNNKKYLGTST